MMVMKWGGLIRLWHNLIEYANNHARTLESLWQSHKDDLNDNMTDSELFKFKGRINETPSASGNTKDVEIGMQLKYLSNIWRTL